jgi:hypothetical protein
MAVQAIGARPTQLVRCALVPLARAQGRGRVCVVVTRGRVRAWDYSAAP